MLQELPEGRSKQKQSDFNLWRFSSVCFHADNNTFTVHIQLITIYKHIQALQDIICM